MTDARILVIIPTYPDAETLPRTVPRVREPHDRHDRPAVDGASPDGTGPRAAATAAPAVGAGRGSGVDSGPAHARIGRGAESNRSPKFSEPRLPDRLYGAESWRAKPRPTQLSNPPARVSPAAGAGSITMLPIPFVANAMFPAA